MARNNFHGNGGIVMRLKIRILWILIGLGILGGGLPAVANLSYCFTSGTQVATSGSNYVASGSLSLSLGFAPTPGTNLTVIKNTGLPFISGTFDNVPQGGTVTLTYDGISYNYVANYYGGNGRSFVLQWPGIGLNAWGANDSGQLGNGTVVSSSIPVTVNTDPLNGKTIVAIAAGYYHNLALTADGKVYAWGNNHYGQLGNRTTSNSSKPVIVYADGALAGKTVVAIAAGTYYSLALTSDGKVFAWGAGLYGELGDMTDSDRSEPVAVWTNGVLAGKKVVAIAAGDYHSLALTSEGKVVDWGSNNSGQLGNNATNNSVEPISVDIGTPIVAIDAGVAYSLALNASGQAFAWGANFCGQLGIGDTAAHWPSIATAVYSGGVLAGKAIVAISGGFLHTLAATSDGKVYSWGYNRYGQLGSVITSTSSTPVAVDNGAMGGSAIVAVAAGENHSLALSADGKVFAWGGNSSGQLGTNSIALSLVPVMVNAWALGGKGAQAIAGAGSNSLAMVYFGPPTITTNPIMQVGQMGPSGVTVNITAAAADNFAFTTQWQVSTTGTAGPFSNIVGNSTATTGTLILTNVTSAQNGYAYRAVFANNAGGIATPATTLTIVNGPDAPANFTSDKSVFLETDENLCVSGSLPMALGFAPAPGSNLTVVKNTGLAFISGSFSNIQQGGTVSLKYNGITYNYIANYYGGNGRSLVLQWPYTKIAGWGSGASNINSTVPVDIATNGVLNGKTVTIIATGETQTLALTADGKIYVMGSVPTLLNTGTAMAGKMVTSIAAGSSHYMALTSDGQVFCWGANYYGQLGNSSNTDSALPVAVSSTGGLSGKTVTAIAAGNSHSLALTSDGQVFSWGRNSYGQLGNNSTTNSSVPVAVASTGALAGKAVTLVAAGNSHSMALTSDGQVYCWGYNYYGQLGNNSTTNSSVPVAVSSTGVLTGKTVSLIAAGASHCMALTSDNHVVAWGCNLCGQLGNKSTTSGSVPVAVSALWENSGKTAGAIEGGGNHSLVCTTDGSVYAWGYGMYGQLGNNSRSDSSVPVSITTGSSSALNNNATVIRAGFNSSVALFAWSPQAPIVTNHPVSITGTYGSSISFTAVASSDLPASVKWQVSSTGTTGTFIDIKDNPSATTTTLTSVASQNGYAYRAVFTSDAGIGISNPATLTLLPTFALFQSQYGLQGSGPNEDPYHTGINNLVSYAFGLTPSTPERSQLPSTDIQSNYLRISYSRQKNAVDLGYVVEVSSDLKTWSSGPGYTSQISVTPIDDAREQIIERDLIPTSSEPRRFIRIRITH